MEFLTEVAQAVATALGRKPSEIEPHLAASRDTARGDISLPCFKLAGELGRKGKDAAVALAQEIAAGVKGGSIAGAEAAGPYVNFRLEPAAVAERVLRAAWESDRWGGSDEGRGKTIVIDFSSPNIAKPFHLGHLRSTVIGWSLRQTFRALGYRVVGVNHLGDWGTQFGFMITAWKRWGAEGQARIDKGERDVDVFVEMYTKINQAAETDSSVRDEARDWFAKLEKGDKDARALWQFFVERSKKEFARIYEVLGITHESDAGESFYEDKMQPALDRLKAAGLLVPGKTRREEALEAAEKAQAKVATAERELAEAQRARASEKDPKKAAKLDEKMRKLEAGLPALKGGAAKAAAEVPAKEDGKRPLGVQLEGDGPDFCMLVKGDGSTTYATRDIAAGLYRGATYSPERVIYVVGNEQRDHFQTWFKVVEKLGEPWAKGLVHVGFGKYLGLSTRKGTAVFLEEVLERARARAREAADAATKKVDLSVEEKERVARSIGVGAVKFFDLKSDRTKDIDLAIPGDDSKIDLDRILDLKGETGPYLQFAHARLAGILRKHGKPVSTEIDWSLLAEPETRDLIRAISEFPATVKLVTERLEPSVIARYLIGLSSLIHVCLDRHRVLDAQPSPEQAARGVTSAQLTAARALLVACAKKTMAAALELLGVEALEQM